MKSNPLSAWWSAPPHDERRSVDLVRGFLAIALVTHPLHALVHPSDVRVLAEGLAARGLPLSTGLAWTAIAVQLAASVALVVPRLIVAGAVASMGVVAGGAVLLLAPRWYVVGGLAEDGHPGVEYNVLLLGCLLGVLFTYARRRGATDTASVRARRGLDIIRVASALALLAHGYGPFVRLDVTGMHAWGEAMSQDGWPYGVALVWSIKGLELVCALLRLAGRFMVPACLGHLSYLVPALWIEHRLAWFDVGPGENGIEFPLTIVVATVACLLAYAPQRVAESGEALRRYRSVTDVTSRGSG